MLQTPRNVELFPTEPNSSSSTIINITDNAPFSDLNQFPSHARLVNEQQHPSTAATTAISLISAFVVGSTTSELHSEMSPAQDQLDLQAFSGAGSSSYYHCIPWNDPVFQQQQHILMAMAMAATTQPSSTTTGNFNSNPLTRCSWSHHTSKVSFLSAGGGLETSSIGIYPSKKDEPGVENGGGTTIVLDDTVVSSSCTPSCSIDESDDDDDNDSDGPECRFELFDDVSVLTADSGGIEEEDEENEATVYEFFDDVSVLSLASTSSSTSTSSTVEKVDNEDHNGGANLHQQDTFNPRDLESSDGPPSVVTREVASSTDTTYPVDQEENPIPYTTTVILPHATDDSRLMSFLLDFCSNESTHP